MQSSHPPTPSPSGGFLFATFKGEHTPLTEQVYFALGSEDGRDWQVLNGGEPVLVSPLGEKGVRDPFLVRARIGERFYLLATDLSIHHIPDWGRAVRAGSQSLIIWESDDLVHWSEPRRVKVAPDDAGCAWAPEVVYDEEASEYLVFWASTNGFDDYAQHRIWASRTTDFTTFSPPFVYIEKETAVIDTDIVRGNDGKYYRFSKDEKFKAITLEVSAGLMGPWQEITNFSLSQLQGYEGPQCFSLGEGWCLLLDHYAVSEGYKAFVTDDLASGQFVATDALSFPFRFRHGSVLPITITERERLQVAW